MKGGALKHLKVESKQIFVQGKKSLATEDTEFIKRWTKDKSCGIRFIAVLSQVCIAKIVSVFSVSPVAEYEFKGGRI